MPQDKLTRQQVVEAARRLEPEFYDDWGDDQIYRTLLRDRPELRSQVEQLSTGERYYKQFGASESADFWKRFGFQFGSQWEGMKAGMVGLAPWNSAEAGEKARGYAKEVYEAKIANDTELQAYLAWKEDEPGWTNLHTATRSLSEALPSLAIAMTSLVAAPFTKGGSLVAGAVALAPIAMMEGTNMYNEMMATLVDEVGLSPEEARGYAYTGTAMYTPFATIMERLGVKAWGRTVGIGDDAANAIFRKHIAQKLVDYGLDEKRLAKMTARSIIGASNILQNSLVEGSTEGLQAFGQNAITRGFELGLGESQLEVVEAIEQSFKETWDNPAVWEEGFAGATTGVLGGFGAFSPGAVSVEKQQEILDKIAAKEAGEDYVPPEPAPEIPIEKQNMERVLKPMARELGIKGFSKMRKPELVKAIKKAQKEQEEAQVTSPGATSGDLTGRYLNAIVNTDEMQDVLDEASAIDSEKETSENKGLKAESGRINQANLLQNAGKKILSLIVGNENANNIIKTIEESKDSDTLLGLAREELNVAIENSDNPRIRALTIKNDRASIVDALKGFAIRGVAEDVVTDEGELADATSGDIKFTYDPSEISQQEEDIITEGEPEIEGTPVETEGLQTEEPDEVVERAEATAPSKVKVGSRGLMSSEAKKAASDDPSKVPAGMKRNVAILKKSNNAFEVVEEKDKSYVLQEVDPVSQEPTGKSIEVPKVIGGMPIMSLVQDTTTQSAEAAEEVSRIITPGQGVKVGETSKEAPSKDKPKVVVTKKEAIKETKSTTEDGKPLQKGMSVTLSDEILEANKNKNIKVGRGIKNALRKLKGNINYEITAVTTKGFYVKDPNKPKEAAIFVHDELTTLDKKKVPVLTTKAPKLSDIIEDDSAPKPKKKVLVKDLKKELSKRGLPLSGKKAELQKRLDDDDKAKKDAPKKVKKKKSKVVAGTKVDEVRLRYDSKKKQFYVPIGGKRVGLTPEEKKEATKLTKEDKKLGENPPSAAKKALDEKVAAFEERVLDRVKGLDRAESPAKTDNKEESDFDSEVKKSANRDLSFKFQDDKSSSEILISEDRELANKILSRLKKHFPFVDTKTFEGVLNLFGKERIGFAMERLVAWSTTDGRMDTMPHEYAHIYIKLFRNDPLVKQGIAKFGTEEDLVKYIGLYYVNRLRNRKILPRIKIWLKQFTNRLRRFFGKDVTNLEEFIAEEFYQGRFLGMEAVVGDQFVDFMDKEEEVSGEESSPDFTNVSSDHHLTQFYKKTLGIYLDKIEHYPQILEIAKKSKNLETYIENLYAFGLKVATERGNTIKGKLEIENLKDITAKGKDGKYLLMKENPSAWTELNMDWLKALTKISRFDPDNPSKQGIDSRIYQTLTIDGKKASTKGDGITIAGLKSRINGKKFSQNNVMNFFERQQQEDGTNTRLLTLPIKEIARTNVRHVDKERFWTSANFMFDKGQIFSLQMKYASQYWNQILTLLETDGFGKKGMSFKTLITEPWMASFLGSKLGDNSAGISTFTQVEDRPLNITPASYNAFFESELENGNINENHLEELLKDSEKLDKSKNPLINSTIEEYLDKRIAEGAKRSEIINEINQYGKNAVIKKYKMAQTLSRYKAWQQIRVPDYMIHEKSVADSMTRLSIDLAEGVIAKGLGKSKLMVIPKDAKVQVKDENGNWVDAGTYDDFDGATFTSGGWFNKISRILGSDRLSQLKTFVRQRDVDTKDPNKVDYIGMKHMQQTPHKNMRFYDPTSGEMIAQVVGGGRSSYFQSADGQKFDLIASKNEAKMMYGKYNDSDYAIHELREESVLVHDIQRKSKTTASHPIAFGEMILSAAMGKNPSSEAKEVIKQIRIRYREIVNHYVSEITSLYDDSSNFMKFIKKEKEDGKVPMELDEYLEMIKADGKGIWVNAIRSHLTPILNSRLIRDGLFKGRAWGGKASKVYLKPGVHLKIKDGNVIVSSDNKVAYRQVEAAFAKKNKIKGGMKKYWTSLGIKPHEQHKRIVILNQFLEDNEVNVLIHRNPIQKPTGVVLRRIQRLQEGFHGENMFLSWSDVKNVLDGDWDGDTAQFEFISDEYSNALKKWQKSEGFKRLNKVVSVNPFSSRVDNAPDGEQPTSLSSFDDISESVSQNAKLDGSTGTFVNAKTIMAQLFYKDFKLFHDSLQDNKAWIQVSDPESIVTMDYAPLVKENLTKIVEGSKTELDVIHENGDLIVDKDGNEVGIDFDGDIFLQTTKGHEISTLFQMAVDSGKYDVFGTILNESKLNPFELMLSKIFETSDGTPLFTKEQLNNRTEGDSAPVSKMMGMLALVYRAQNLSQIRAGKSLNSEAKSVASFGINIDQANELNDRFFDSETGVKYTSKEYAERFQQNMFVKGEDVVYDESKHGSLYGKSLTLKNIKTPLEELITGLSTVASNDFYQVTDNINALRQAHVEAVDDLVSNAADLPMWGEFVSGKRIDDYRAFHEFLYKPQEFNGESLTFVEQWQKLLEKTQKQTNIQSDLNDEFISFVDRHIEQWNKLSEPAQIWATMKYLEGFGNDVHILKLPPLALMNKKVISRYLPIYERKLRAQSPELSEANAKKNRENASYFKHNRRVNDTYTAIDEKLEVCRT